MGQRFKSKKAKLGLVILIILVVAVPIYIIFSRWANAPADTNAAVTSASTQAATPQYKAFTTPYFSTQIPYSWRITSHPNGTRQQWLTYGPTGQDGQVAFVSDVLPSDQLAGVGDYILRTRDIADYSPLTDPGFPSGSKAFRAINGQPEYSVFWIHGDRYVSVSASGAAPDTLLAGLRHTFAKWQWK